VQLVVPLNSRAFSLPALDCWSTRDPSVTTAQVPPDLDQPLVEPASKLALNAVAAEALVASATAAPVSSATGPATMGRTRERLRGRPRASMVTSIGQESAFLWTVDPGPTRVNR